MADCTLPTATTARLYALGDRPFHLRNRTRAPAIFGTADDILQTAHTGFRGFARHCHMCQLFTNNLAQCGKKRLLVDVGGQRVIDQGLVIATACGFDDRAKMVEDRIVQTNRNLGLARTWCDDRPSFSPREIDIAIWLSLHLAHIASFDEH